MKQLNLFALITLSMLISCRENKNASATKQEVTEVQNPSTNEATPTNDTAKVTVIETGEAVMPLIISFYSIGEGIDRGQTEKLMAFLADYEKKEGKKIEYSEVHWGREGETDFCFPMIGFSDNQVTDFLKGAKDALNTAKHVHFLQNQVCRKGR